MNARNEQLNIKYQSPSPSNMLPSSWAKKPNIKYQRPSRSIIVSRTKYQISKALPPQYHKVEVIYFEWPKCISCAVFAAFVFMTSPS